MAHELAFADAMRPAPFRCLSRKLREYSLAHELLLHRYRNPIRCPGQHDLDALTEDDWIGALTSAVFICTKTAAQVARLDAGHRPRSENFWNWLNRGIDHTAEMIKFRAYLAAGLGGPQFAPADPDFPGRQPGAPEILSLYQWLADHRAKLCRRVDDLWDYPFALARFECYTALESAGHARLKNDQDPEPFEDWIRQQEEKVARGEIILPPITPLESSPLGGTGYTNPTPSPCPEPETLPA